MDHYHDTHYQLFHTRLPNWLTEGGRLEPLAYATAKGDGGSILVGFWRAVAKSVSGSMRLRAPLNLTRDDFFADLTYPSAGKVAIAIRTPPVKGPLEAAYVVVVFDEQDPKGTLRYFTYEAPAEDGGPWFVGEWRNREHHNHGAIGGLDLLDFYKRVMSILGISVEYEQEEGGETPSTVSDYSWYSDPIDLANHAYSRLLQIRESGGDVLVMNAKKTRGLSGDASSYLQFMWGADGDLVVEIQGDYSYCGLSIASNRWPILQEVGMQTPVAGAGNFVQVIPSSWTPEQFKNRLTQVFRAFVVVLAPVGEISEISF